MKGNSEELFAEMFSKKSSHENKFNKIIYIQTYDIVFLNIILILVILF